MAITHHAPPTPTLFRRHPLRRLQQYLSLAALHGILAGLARQTFTAGNRTLALGLVITSAAVLLTIIGLAIQEHRFNIVITRDHIIINDSYPFGSYRIIERMYVRAYLFPPNPIGSLFDTGTLVIAYGDETLVLDGLTPFSTLRATLEVL